MCGRSSGTISTPWSAALLARLDALPKVPADCFGERGFQSVKGDVSKMRPGDAQPRAGEVGLRIGGDVAAFRRSAPSFLCDPRALAGGFARRRLSGAR